MLMLRRMRRNAAAVAMLVVVAGGVAAWLSSAAGSAAAPTVPTGASFNLAVARVHGAADARAMAARLDASGLPAFTRPLNGGALHQVVVGPYVAIDEAEDAQRRLRARGLGAAMLVDESVRRVPHAAMGPAAAAAAREGAQLVLVGAAGRHALVIELGQAPRRVDAPRHAGSLVEIEAGPLAAPVSPRVWDGPGEAALVNQVAVDQVERDGESFLRLQVALASAVQARVRTVGSRVYVDMWPATDRPPAQMAGRRHENRAVPVFTAPRPMTMEEYRAAVDPAIARFEAIQPFLTAALGSPDPAVLIALGGTLAELDAWMRSIDPPADAAASHAALVASVASAIRLLEQPEPADRD